MDNVEKYHRSLKLRFDSCVKRLKESVKAREKLHKAEQDYNNILCQLFLAMLRAQGMDYCSAGRHAAPRKGIKRQFLHKKSENRFSDLADKNGFVELKAVYSYCLECQKKEKLAIKTEQPKKGEFRRVYPAKKVGGRFFARINKVWEKLPDEVSEIGTASCWVERQAQEVGLRVPPNLSFHDLDNIHLCFEQLRDLAEKFKEAS